MNGFPWLTVAGGIPLLGAIVITLVPKMPPDSAPDDVAARDRLAKVEGWQAVDLGHGYSLLRAPD